MDISSLLGWAVAVVLAVGLVWFVVRVRGQQDGSATSAPAHHTPAPFSELAVYLGEQEAVNPLLRRAAEWLRDEFQLPLVTIYPYDSASQELSNPVVVGGEPNAVAPRFRLGSGIVGEVGSTRTARHIDSVPRDPRFGPTMPGIESAYVAPLVGGSTLLGVINAQSADPLAFPPERRAALDRAAASIALQTLMVRRLSDSRQAIARFDRFQGLAQRLIERLDTKELLQPIVEAAREMLDTQMSVMFELRPDDDQLYPVAWSGISEQVALALKPRLKEDLKGLVAWARRPARTPDLRTDQRTARATEAVVAGMLSELAVPVLYRDTLYGTLAVETNVYRNFTDEEMNLLVSLAAQAGIALRNAQLFEQAQTINRQLEVALVELKASQIEIERAHQAEIKAYETELETAREIQTSLLPQGQSPVPQIRLAARNIPARHVSGDFYQYLLLPDGKLGIAVGDVTGKGIPAALMMAVTTTALRDEIVQTASAADVLNDLNKRLLERMQQNHMNSALMMAVFDPATSCVDVANAGMIPPYLFSSGAWQDVEVGGYPLGASERTHYTAKTVTMQPGAMLLFLSDGVIEAQNAKGEFLGFERFEQLLASLPKSFTPEQVIETIIQAVYDHTGRADPQDDVTVVVAHAVAD